jgi:mannose-6-phosphate isomerase-like protein (cupin superfamily)
MHDWEVGMTFEATGFMGAHDGPVAAPDHHKVIFENEHVRVLETRIKAGDTAPIHHHLLPQVMYVLSGSHFHRRDHEGNTMVDTRATPEWDMPQVMYSPGTPLHTLENTGDDDLVVIGVELKALGTQVA